MNIMRSETSGTWYPTTFGKTHVDAWDKYHDLVSPALHNKLYPIMAKLAAYERVGLSPDQIEDMKMEMEAMRNDGKD